MGTTILGYLSETNVMIVAHVNERQGRQSEEMVGVKVR